MPAVAGPGLQWRTTLASLLAHLEDGGPRSPGARRHVELLERTLISGLLVAQPHSFSGDLYAATDRGPETAVDRVVEAIRSAPETPYSLADLCRIGCVSARGLQAQFQAQHGMSPMQYLRQVRLDMAHDALRAGNLPVTEVAYDAGFSNVGRFARAYRLRFGELPSQTRERPAVVAGRTRRR